MNDVHFTYPFSKVMESIMDKNGEIIGIKVNTSRPYVEESDYPEKEEILHQSSTKFSSSTTTSFTAITTKTPMITKPYPPAVAPVKLDRQIVTLEPTGNSDLATVWTTMNDGRCSVKKYNRLAFIFEARAIDVVNMRRAVTRFKQLSNQVAIISRKWSDIGCTSEAFQVPCTWLEFPLNRHACALAKTFARLYLHVESHCPEKWKNAHHAKYQELMISSQPIAGECRTAPLSSEEIQRSDRIFAESFGIMPHVMLKDFILNNQMSGKSGRQKGFEQKKMQRKENQLAREQQKLARIRQKKMKRMILEKLETQLEKAMPTEIDAILARSDIRLNSVYFATEETEEFAEDYQPEHERCYFSDFSNQNATLHAQGIAKFDILLTRKYASGSFSTKWALKVRTRYDALLKKKVI